MCARVLGISIKHIQKKLDKPELYCMDCAKEKLNSLFKPEANSKVFKSQDIKKGVENGRQ